jgi:hypothetical protein
VLVDEVVEVIGVMVVDTIEILSCLVYTKPAEKSIGNSPEIPGMFFRYFAQEAVFRNCP